MVTVKELDAYIDQIPPAPKVLQETIALLDKGDLVKAAIKAEEDKALTHYLRTLVNRPIYGFANEVKELKQIFGILGLSNAKQILYNYFLHLIVPKKWELFEISNTIFSDLQALLNINWNKLLVSIDIDDKDISSSIALLPASIIVCESIFSSKKEDVELLRSVKQLDYNTILKRLSGMDLFDVGVKIAAKWEMPEKIGEILQTASGVKPSKDEQIQKLGKYMHLLFFYALSTPKCINSGLNDFLEFQPDYIADIYENFSTVIGVE